MKLRTLILTGVLMATATAAQAAGSQKITISSDPAGAMVFIDDAYQGTAPVTAELAAGTHHLKLVRKDYSDWTSTITVPLDKPALNVALKPAGKGSLRVTSDPAKCTVFLDGREMGITPLLMNDLAADVYELRVQKTNFEAHQQTVDVTDGKDEEIHVELKSRVEQHFQAKLAEDPNDLSMYTEMGHYYLLEGKWDAAREIFKKGVDVSAGQAVPDADIMRFYQEMSKVFTGQFRFTDDMKAFLTSFQDVMEYAIEKGPKQNIHYQRLISLYAAMGHADEVARLADKINAADPGRGIYKEIGGIYRERGMTQEAVKMLTKALGVKNDFDTRVALGSVYHRSGKYDLAVEQYAAAEKMNPTPAERAELNNYLARLYSQKGEYDKAIAYIDKAIDDTKGGQISWLMLKVNILVEAGRCDEATAIVKQQLDTLETGREKRNAKEMLELIRRRCKQKSDAK